MKQLLLAILLLCASMSFAQISGGGNATSATVTADSSTNASMCLTWVTGVGGVPLYSSCSDIKYNPSSKTFTVNGPIVGNSITTGTAPTACGSATGCFAGTEASTSGTPTAGQDYFRFDSTAHALKGSYNNGAEFIMLPAPGTSGNVMKSDGTNWTSAAAGSGLMNYTMMSFNSITQASTKFMCLLQQSTNDVGAACLWPVSGTITTMTCFASVPANGQTITYTLDNNTTPSVTAVCTITGAASASLPATTCRVTGLSISIVAGQSASTQEVTSATSGTISGQRCDYTISGAN